MSLEKSFDAAEAEARIYAAWEASGAFAAGASKRRDETFCIMIPPPNVTGSLHMGHAFNNTLQDILTRWHRMRGFDTLWQPGQDHAGIATQMVVERELAKDKANATRREMGREAFTAKVWEWKAQSGGTIINQLKRLGASCDWSRNAFTMSGAPGAPKGEEGNFHDAVIKVFVDLFNKGFIYRGKRLVNWDPHFETAISDLEVEQVEQDGHLWRLRYRLENGETYEHPTEFDEDGNVTATETRDYITVATTRPETMLGDTGVAVHPDDRRYAHLIGKTVRLPLVGRSIPIVADTYADPEKGTGAVKITPAHDFNDWEVGQRCGLAAINIMTPRAGMFIRDNEELAAGADAAGIARLTEAIEGTDRYEARDWIIRMAETEGWLDGIDPDRHMVPHGDRSKVAIEPLLTDQWFVDSARIVQPALDAVRDGRTEIQPEQHRKVYFNWLENIEPWCISRQLWWGHQVPVWYGPGVEEDGRIDYSASGVRTFCAASFAEAAQQAKAYYGVEHVHEKDDLAHALEDQLESFVSEENSVSLWRDPDVLDTWFSSGLWPIGTLGWPEDTPELKRYFPTSTLVTGFDIIFFWVARMMMMQLAVVNEVPFRRVYVHALVRDEKGKKMSKSLGNVLDPLELIDEFGADAVRFTMTSMAAMGRDLKLSSQRIQGYRNFSTKLWNAARFAEMNGAFTGPALTGNRTVPKPSAAANRWIAGEVARTREAVDEALDAHRFNDAANTLYSFVWGTVCDWYLELAKPLFDSGDQNLVSETRATMAWVIDQCLILLHPFMPFVTEDLWGSLALRSNMLVVEPWPEYTAEGLTDPAAHAEMSWVISLIEEIRSIRGEMGVPPGSHIPVIVQDLDAAGQAALATNRPLIERLARVEGFEHREPPKGSVTVAVSGGTLALPLQGIIDVSAEKARLEKSAQKLAKEVGGLEGRLNNPKFVESAPEEVVEETRENLTLRREEAARIARALERLGKMV